MVKGIIFFEQGDLQQIGELLSLQYIIKTMEEALPIFRQKEKDRILSLLTREDIEKIKFLDEEEDPRQPYMEE